MATGCVVPMAATDNGRHRNNSLCDLSDEHMQTDCMQTPGTPSQMQTSFDLSQITSTPATEIDMTRGELKPQVLAYSINFISRYYANSYLYC